MCIHTFKNIYTMCGEYFTCRHIIINHVKLHHGKTIVLCVEYASPTGTIWLTMCRFMKNNCIRCGKFFTCRPGSKYWNSGRGHWPSLPETLTSGQADCMGATSSTCPRTLPNFVLRMPSTLPLFSSVQVVLRLPSLWVSRLSLLVPPPAPTEITLCQHFLRTHSGISMLFRNLLVR